MAKRPGGMLRAVVHEDFRTVWASSWCFQLGYWFVSVALQLVVSHDSGNDPLALGVLYFVTFLPFLLFAMPAGAFADAHDRRRLLIASLVGGVLIAVSCIVLSLAHLFATPHAFVTGFLTGTAMIVISAATQSMTPNVVPPEDVGSAVLLQAAGNNVARILGPSVAGAVLLMWSTGGSFAAWAVLLIAGTILARRIPKHLNVRPAAQEHEPVLRSMARGFGYARRTPPTVTMLVTVAATSLFGSAYSSQMPVISHRVSDHPDQTFLVLSTLAGAGALGGILWLSVRSRPPSIQVTSSLLAALGIVVVAMGQVRSEPVMGLIVVVANALVFIIMTTMQTHIQELVDDAYRGRVMALYFMAWGGLIPISGITIGAVVGQFGPAAGFAVYGGIAAIAGVLVTIRAIRNPHLLPGPNRIDELEDFA